MSKFRKKSVVIEAILWLGNNIDEMGSFLPEVTMEYVSRGFPITIITLEGKMEANVGDWIIKGVKGEFYPCKPDIFEATYEPV